MTSSNRRQREIERTRVEILEGAARAILRHGYAATTMQDIATEADYTAASLYTYFKNKDDIVHAFEEHLRAEVFAAFEAPMPSDLSFRQQIEFLFQRLAESAAKTTDVRRVFFDVLPAGRGLALLAERIEQWMRERAGVERLGVYTADDLATFLAGILHGFSVRRPECGTENEPGIMIPTLVDLFFHGVSKEAQ